MDLAHDNGGHQNVDSVATQYNDLTGASSNYEVTFGGACSTPTHIPRASVR